MKARIVTRALCGTALLWGALASAEPKPVTPADWPVFGYDDGASRYSPLTQITPQNVAKLRLAWSYDLRPADEPKPDLARLLADAATRRRSQQGMRPSGAPAGPPAATSVSAPPAGAMDTPAPVAAPAKAFGPPAASSGSEFTPIVVGSHMYFGSPFGRIVSLDAATGKELWSLPLPNHEQPALRGLAYWPGDASNAPRLVVTTRSNKLLTIDPATGVINSPYKLLELRTPDVMTTYPNGFLNANGVPVLYRNLAILGSRGQENPALGPRGDVRAYDILTGRLVWRFNAIPEPGEKNFGTWAGDSWKNRAGVNVWNSPTVDVARGIVYLAFATPAYDRDGTSREGQGLYGTSLVAVDAATGAYKWHFQTVHHDLWDRDMTGVPTLFDVKRGGKVIPAVAAINKQSLLFILDRRTGKPLFDVHEVPVPASEVPGEHAWPTQPVPVKPEPLARQSIDLTTDISDVTPEHKAWCQNFVTSLGMVSTKQYQPIGYTHPTVMFPGTGGGMNWWGGAFDRKNGNYILNVINRGTVDMMRKGPNGQLQSAFSVNSWFSDVRDVDLPCQKGPWGEIIAVNVSTGDVAWRRPLGVTDSLPAGKRDTGRPMSGGPIATAGGLIFVAATDDRRFRAFDSKTGKQLWETTLDAAGNATPLTYQANDGRQYVALIATGGSFLGDPATSDKLVVYALP